MNVRKLLDDDRAVSPVIGVILMVAITVILAAVIGTFVLGLGDQVSQTTPSSSFGFDYDRDDTAGDNLTISHNGGETLNANEVNVTISGAANGSNNGPYTWASLDSTTSSGDDITAGNSAELNSSTIGVGTNIYLTEATVRVVWQAAEGDSSAQLGRWDGPDA